MLPIQAHSFGVGPNVLAATVRTRLLARPGAFTPRSGLLTPSRMFGVRTLKRHPEDPTTSSPLRLIHRAMDRVHSTIRLPDRGSWYSIHGTQYTMPDGTTGGRYQEPTALLRAMNQAAREILQSRGNPQIRQTQLKALQQDSYLRRQDRRLRVASPYFPAPGGVDYAEARRFKPTTPTGIQGDRAVMTSWSSRGYVYASAVTPAEALARAVNGRSSGPASNTTVKPVALPAASAPKPEISTKDALGKAFAWASPAAESGQTPTSKAGEMLERYGLLIAVGVLGFFLIRRG